MSIALWRASVMNCNIEESKTKSETKSETKSNVYYYKICDCHS